MFSIFNVINLGFAEEPLSSVSETIIVEAHRDIEVYVAPIVVQNFSKNIEANYSEHSVFGYTSSHSHNAQIENDMGFYEPLLLNNDKIKVYNKDTIGYSWEGCDYLKDAKACTYQNNHYLLETYVSIDENELVVALYLLDSELQIISQGIVTDTRTVRWIKQQEQVMNKSLYRPNNIQNCSGNSCQALSRDAGSYNSAATNKKEELPLKWEIPHKLLNKHFHQASLLLWCSTRLSLY